MSGDLSRKIEEELRKEEQPQQQQPSPPPQQVQPQLPPVREVRPTIGRAEVEAAMEQARRYEEDLYRYGYGEPPLFATSLLDRLSPDQLAKLLGEEGSDLTKTVITLWMLEELSMSRWMKWMMFKDWLDARSARAMQTHSQPRQGSELVEVVRELVNAVASRSSDVNTLRELASIVKDIAASVKSPGVPKSIVRKLEEIAESVREGRKSPREALNEVKEMVSLVREVAEALRLGYGPSGTTTTVAPLSYSGTAPWILHPDARHALKDVVDMVVDSVTKIALALKGVAPPLPAASKSRSSVPKELLRG